MEHSSKVKLYKNIFNFVEVDVFFTRCNCRNLKSLSRSSPIVERQGVFSLLTPDTARSASVEPIDEMQPIIKSCRKFGRLLGSADLVASTKLSVGSFSSYAALPSTLFFLCGCFTALLLFLDPLQ